MDAIFISRENAHDKESWSGIPYYMSRSLEAAGFRLRYIGPLQHRFRLLWKIKSRLLRLRGWDYNNLSEPAVLKSYARQTERQLQKLQGRVLLSCGKPQLAYLNTNLPIIFFDDASVPSISALYPNHTNFSPPIKQNLLAAERRILEKCLFACYTSDWAAEAALATYGRQFESKIKVVPLGANIEHIPTMEEVEQAIQSRERTTCNLLFVGVDWSRKGGDIAVAVAAELRRRGIPARLNIVGCVPPVAVPDFVDVHGFISKNDAAGRALIEKLYRESHFFLLPTRAEAYGLVFVEACAHGLPSLACKVGGVPTIIQNGANGWLFSTDAPAADYAERIQSLWNAPEAYMNLCRSAFQSTQTRLNWKRFGETVYTLVTEALR